MLDLIQVSQMTAACFHEQTMFGCRAMSQQNAHQQQAEPEINDLDKLIREGNDVEVSIFLRLIPHPADLAELLDELDAELWPKVLRNLDNETAADVVAELDEATRDEVLDELKPKEIAELAIELESDAAADLIAELEPHEVDDVLAEIEKVESEDAQEIRTLLAYAEDSAGGLMQTELVALHKSASVDDAIQRIRTVFAEDTEDIHDVYVLDDNKVYLGQISLSQLVVSRGDVRLSDIMEEKFVEVDAEVDQEEVLRLFRKYDLASLAVTDASGILLGCILHDDVIDVAQEEADEDALLIAGTSTEELVYGDRVLRIVGVRLPWLLTNLAGALIAGYLLYLFRNVIGNAMALLAFIPVINGTSGNVGAQSATIMTRGFATGRVQMDEIWQTLYKEVRVGMLMGLSCGLAVGILASTPLWSGVPYLGVIVGLSLVIAMTWAATIGTLAPALFKRLNIDPAIAAGPIVTTSNDIAGIVIYMLCAIFMMNLL